VDDRPRDEVREERDEQTLVEEITLLGFTGVRVGEIRDLVERKKRAPKPFADATINQAYLKYASAPRSTPMPPINAPWAKRGAGSARAESGKPANVVERHRPQRQQQVRR
jgi:hypothetical protein